MSTDPANIQLQWRFYISAAALRIDSVRLFRQCQYDRWQPVIASCKFDLDYEKNAMFLIAAGIYPPPDCVATVGRTAALSPGGEKKVD